MYHFSTGSYHVDVIGREGYGELSKAARLAVERERQRNLVMNDLQNLIQVADLYDNEKWGYEIIKLNPISSFCITIRTFGSREEMECFNGMDEI